MMNKYTLGTILGTAILGLAKKHSGSSVKIFKGKALTYGAFDRLSFPTISYKPPHLNIVLASWQLEPNPLLAYTFRTITPIQNCKGTPHHNSLKEYINSDDFFEASKELQERLIKELKYHTHCNRDKNQCVSLGEIDTTLVEKATLEILDLNNVLKDNNLYIARINGKFFNQQNFSDFNLLYEFILKRIESSDQINIKLGYYDANVESPIVYPENVLLSKKELNEKMEEINKKIMSHIRDIVHPFGFITYEGPVRTIKLIPDLRSKVPRSINQYIADDITITKTKTGEWIPYRPNAKISKLRKR